MVCTFEIHWLTEEYKNTEKQLYYWITIECEDNPILYKQKLYAEFLPELSQLFWYLILKR